MRFWAIHMYFLFKISMYTIPRFTKTQLLCFIVKHPIHKMCIVNMSNYEWNRIHELTLTLINNLPAPITTKFLKDFFFFFSKEAAVVLVLWDLTMTSIHLDTVRAMFSTQIFFFSISVVTGQQRLLNTCRLPRCDGWEGRTGHQSISPSMVHWALAEFGDTLKYGFDLSTVL